MSATVNNNYNNNNTFRHYRSLTSPLQMHLRDSWLPGLIEPGLVGRGI